VVEKRFSGSDEFALTFLETIPCGLFQVLYNVLIEELQNNKHQD